MTTNPDLAQAREWTKLAVAHETSEVSRAAARIIQSLPDQWVDAEKVEHALTECRGMKDPKQVMAHIEKALLSDPTPRTLADMTEDTRHALVGEDVKVEGWDSPSMLVAVHGDEGAVLGHRWVNPWPFVEVRPLSDLTPVAAPEQEAEDTPESLDQALADAELSTPDLPTRPEDVNLHYPDAVWKGVDEWVRREKEHSFGAEDFDQAKRWYAVELDLLVARGLMEQPQPEDAKQDPQPGEAWLIEYEGKRYEAVYWYSPIYAHWAFVENRERGLKTIEDPEATPVSRLAPERGDVS